MNRKLVLLDGNSITHRAFHALPPMDADGTPTNAVFGFFSMLLRALRDEQAEYLAVAFDPHGPTFRHAQYADYKAGRPPTRPFFRWTVMRPTICLAPFPAAFPRRATFACS